MDERALKLHMDALVCDCHSDSLLRALKGENLNLRSNRGHLDFPRMREGGIDLEVFACWVDPKIPRGEYIKRALSIMDAFFRQIEASSGEVIHACTADEITEAKSQGKLAAVLAVEGGHAIDNSIEVLRIYRRLGVRIMTLTWNNSNDWADSAVNPKLEGGLTDFGKEIVREMNRIGMIVDISHVSDKTFWDALEISDDPIIASHSSARALCDHPRNMSDEMIKALAQKGGVVFVNFYPRYLMKHIEGADPPRVTVERIVEHIQYMVDLVGADYVGLGSDFDGLPNLPEGIEDCTKMPKITELLFERGFSEEEIRKILGENFLRIFREVCD